MGAVALAVRLAVVAWAAPRFPPAADGKYYHLLATRLSQGLGYTWQWPDGVVTPAAHYPVGYPALLSLLYRVTGPSSSWAMVLGAALGALSASLAVVLTRGWGRKASLASGLAVAVHPALVPYAAALMTEGIAAALLLLAAATIVEERVRRPWLRWGLAGIVMGIATLVRPQCIALAPVLGVLAASGGGWTRRVACGAFVAFVALVVVLPWTARNCVAMKKCALVSVNGGWNLLIGAQTDSGAWQPIDVPEPCRTVWDEAQKDGCFAAEARRVMASDPMAFFRKVPAKLAVTFDYFGGAPWYLHESNAEAFDAQAKERLGTADAIASRLLLLVALLAVGTRALTRSSSRSGVGVANAEGLGRWGPPGSGAARVRWGVTALLLAASMASTLSRHAAPAYLGLVGLIALAGPYASTELIFPWTAAVVLSVAATHAVFFGAGRYGLLVAPLIAAMAGVVANATRRCQDAAVDADQAIAGFEVSTAKREESPSTIEHDAG